VGSAQPVRARRFTLKQYLHFSHALVETLEGQQTFPDRARAQLGAKRRVAPQSSILYTGTLYHRSDRLILTVPRKLAQMTAPIARIRVADRRARSKPFRISWLSIHDSLLNLCMHSDQRSADALHVKSQFSPISPNPQAAFRPTSSVFSIACEWPASCTCSC
jgi:hypothetical protein